MSKTIKDALKDIYYAIYNGGNLLSLIIKTKEIKKIENIYKNNYFKFHNFEDFERSYQNEFDIIKKSESAYSEIKKQFKLQKALQPAILTECIVAKTLSEYFALDKFYDWDGGNDVPGKLFNATQQFIGSDRSRRFRYCYYNDKFKVFILQCGDSKTIDIIFVKYNYTIRIEIKEAISKLEECDITGLYNEEGILIIDDSFANKRSYYKDLIELFNKSTNVFDLEGHNFNLARLLDKEKIKNILEYVFNSKDLQMYIFVLKNELLPVFPENLRDFVSFKGSEIRTAGRNSRKLFTPNFARNKIKELNGSIDDDLIVKIPNKKEYFSNGRGQNKITRFNLGSLLYVDSKVIKKDDDFVYFHFNEIKQKVPSIALHLNIEKNDVNLYDQNLIYIENLRF